MPIIEVLTVHDFGIGDTPNSYFVSFFLPEDLVFAKERDKERDRGVENGGATGQRRIRMSKSSRSDSNSDKKTASSAASKAKTGSRKKMGADAGDSSGTQQKAFVLPKGVVMPPRKPGLITFSYRQTTENSKEQNNDSLNKDDDDIEFFPSDFEALLPVSHVSTSVLISASFLRKDFDDKWACICRYQIKSDDDMQSHI